MGIDTRHEKLVKKQRKGYNTLMWQRVKNVYHLATAIFANVWFGYPSRHLTVIGVTGTDGKTTTVNAIYHILSKAGYCVSMISSVGAVISGQEFDTGFHVTTPASWEIQRFFKTIADKKNSEPCFVVLEVTSHALDQCRVYGIDFSICVLTNVTHEHLDYHKTYNRYVAAKAKLLVTAKNSVVVNRDDDSFKIISNFNPPADGQISNAKWVTYGMEKNAEINPGNFPFKTKLIGEFNRYNCLAAIAVCKSLGLSEQAVRDGIESFRPPKGRIDLVHEDTFRVMIDFAHTPNALAALLGSLRTEVKGKLIHVFGSAGERDKTKRPVMGTASSYYADVIILTVEDPRSESVEQITKEIEWGIQNHELRKKEETLFIIPDRQEAIDRAVSIARKGDLVVITGKGHEQSMNFGQGEVAWSDYEAVEKALRKNEKN